jgi:hypothetical protein
MDNNGDSSPTQPPAASLVGNPGYLLFVGLLLVLIIGSLGVLWTRERRLRAVAEQKVLNLRNENQTLRKAMGTIGAFRTTATQPDGS